jgi:hypothetical protein
MVVNSFWPKLMVSGSSAEQPSPASANVSRPSEELFSARTRWRSAAGHHERQNPADQRFGKPFFNGGKQDASRRDRGPKKVSASDARDALA